MKKTMNHLKCRCKISSAYFSKVRQKSVILPWMANIKNTQTWLHHACQIHLQKVSSFDWYLGRAIWQWEYQIKEGFPVHRVFHLFRVTKLPIPPADLEQTLQGSRKLRRRLKRRNYLNRMRFRSQGVDATNSGTCLRQPHQAKARVQNLREEEQKPTYPIYAH
jgi:hypothetical protein